MDWEGIDARGQSLKAFATSLLALRRKRFLTGDSSEVAEARTSCSSTWSARKPLIARDELPDCAAPSPSAAPAAATSSATGSASVSPTAVPSAATPVEAISEIDVGQLLDGMATKSAEKLSWKTSSGGLLKLLGLDSSLASRKELARELRYTGCRNARRQ